MKIKYKTKSTRYRAKLKKHALPKKAIIRSSYELSQNEIDAIKNQFPQIGTLPLETVVDPLLIAGIVLLIGTQRIDLSLAQGLYNLKHYLYEHS